ncbi:hypothetical protein PTTG_06081 [Puccinia triticina 1-1 BBBD Race 1]|uniref:Uncharacterized protein n=1 Tax=Puccinia triticina (isolate 1-1 / race 1 (BBBD)) TaxID=630390 RepID=A0A180GE03_PUCT1|nr:hypothetical protein PTTG_06081 [Puccinia triticina 1-1 BBBD Race 1]
MSAKKVSKAVKGQRRRRRREKIEKEFETNVQKFQTKKPTPSSSNNTKWAKDARLNHSPILIDSESSNDNIKLLAGIGDDEVELLGIERCANKIGNPINHVDPSQVSSLAVETRNNHIKQPCDAHKNHAKPPANTCNSHIEPPAVDQINIDPELLAFQEAEIEARHQGNDLVNYFNLAVDDETSDNDLDDTEDEDEPFQDVWPIFSGNITLNQSCVKRRQLKSGKKMYQQPIVNPDSSSKKLIPAAIPKQTKSDRNKKRKQAIGDKNTMFENYFIRPAPA